MPRYVLFLEENPTDFANVDPAEIQRIVERYSAWSERLAATGQLVDGIKLRDEGGRRLARRGGRVAVTDGPYGEAKEVIGGLFVIEAESYDAATEIAAGCPHLDHGRIALREIELM